MSQQAGDAVDRTDQLCGNCGATVPAEAVTCPACAALLAAYRAPSGAAPGAIAAPDQALPPSPPPLSPPPAAAPEHRPASTSPIGDALRRTQATSAATNDADELARMATTDSRLAREVDAQLRGAKVTFEGADATIENETGAAATDAAATSSVEPVAPVADASPSGTSRPAPAPPRTPASSSPPGPTTTTSPTSVTPPARSASASRATTPSQAARDAGTAPARELRPTIPGFGDRAAPARRMPVRPSELPPEQWQEFEIEDLLSAETRPSWLTGKLGTNLIGLVIFGCVFLAIARQVIGTGGVFLLIVAVIALAAILGMGRMSGRKTTTMTRDRRR